MVKAERKIKKPLEKDMTIGRPLPLIIRFSLPIICGQIIQLTYNMVDMIVVGRILGKNALAAVGACGSLMFLVVGFFIGLCSGFNISTSQKFGAKDYEGVKRCVGASIHWCVLFSIGGTVLGLLATKPMLRLMGTPEEIMADATIYLSTIFAGITVTILYNLCAGILQALGNSKTPLMFLGVAAVVNVIMDIVTIVVLHMGVAGVAYTTILSQSVAGILCLIYIIRRVDVVRLKKEHLRPDFRLLKKQIAFAFPMAIQLSVIALGAIFLQSIVNYFGSTVIAAYAAASKLQQFATQPLYALIIAMAPFAAQNYGKGEYGRLKEGAYGIMKLAIIYSVIIGVVVIFTIPHSIKLFASAGDLDAIMPYAKTYLRIEGFFFIALAFIFIFKGAIQGMGYGKTVIVSSVTELLGRMSGALLAVKVDSFTLVPWGEVAAWVLNGAFVFIVFTAVINKKIKLRGMGDKTASIVN